MLHFQVCKRTGYSSQQEWIIARDSINSGGHGKQAFDRKEHLDMSEGIQTHVAVYS
jgi:hypothetical protein